MESFVVRVDGKDIGDLNAMDELQAIMDAYYDSMVKSIKSLATELDVSEECACDVLYLRSRSRWSPELEQRLIDMHREGNPPNICDFGC